MTPEQQDRMIKFLEILFPNVIIYLFGSRARGTHQETSDYDIALDAGRRLQPREIVQAKNVIEALNIPQKIDVVDMNSIPPEMKKIILREGIIWKS